MIRKDPFDTNKLSMVNLYTYGCNFSWWFWHTIIKYTKMIPKPMVKLKRKPILMHIINHYKKFGFQKFIIASGYKGKVIKNFFKKKNKNIKVIDTGLNT